MLLKIVLAAKLACAITAATSSPALPPDDLGRLPATLSETRCAQMRALLPVPQTPATAQSKASPAPEATSAKASTIPPPEKTPLQKTLEKIHTEQPRRVVIVTLKSHHTVVGRLYSVNDDHFVMSNRGNPKPVSIRYDEVVGNPRTRVASNVVIGRTIAGISSPLLIPAAILAAPFILGLLASEDFPD